jgi:hypothetical protein
MVGEMPSVVVVKKGFLRDGKMIEEISSVHASHESAQRSATKFMSARPSAWTHVRPSLNEDFFEITCWHDSTSWVSVEERTVIA